jgi:hypothetical protein
MEFKEENKFLKLINDYYNKSLKENIDINKLFNILYVKKIIECLLEKIDINTIDFYLDLELNTLTKNQMEGQINHILRLINDKDSLESILKYQKNNLMRKIKNGRIKKL